MFPLEESITCPGYDNTPEWGEAIGNGGRCKYLLTEEHGIASRPVTYAIPHKSLGSGEFQLSA
jgi:hypothetical protein